MRRSAAPTGMSGHAVDRGRFLGVCGDARFINDFATVQSAQALLETYEASGNERYLEAAVRAARIYACSIYTHPQSKNVPVRRKDCELRDWQLSQTGLCFEHGGSTGSATKSGPILLTSHCGLYTRLAAMTGDSLFVDLARTAAIAREEFLNPDTKIATYYWSQFDRGPGPFPHHAWWQLGWIVDYLLCEAECRSEGLIAFPRGFVTPKVGPQRITGFAPGRIGQHEARPDPPPGTRPDGVSRSRLPDGAFERRPTALHRSAGQFGTRKPGPDHPRCHETRLAEYRPGPCPDTGNRTALGHGSNRLHDRRIRT